MFYRYNIFNKNFQYDFGAEIKEFKYNNLDIIKKVKCFHTDCCDNRFVAKQKQNHKISSSKINSAFNILAYDSDSDNDMDNELNYDENNLLFIKQTILRTIKRKAQNIIIKAENNTKPKNIYKNNFYKEKKETSFVESLNKKKKREQFLCEKILKQNKLSDIYEKISVKNLIIQLFKQYKTIKLCNLNLQDLDLSYVNFTRCKEITNVDFSGSNLTNSNFSNLLITNVIMKYTKLHRTNFNNTIFMHVNFNDSDFYMTKCEKSYFDQVCFNNAILLSKFWLSKFIDCKFINTTIYNLSNVSFKRIYFFKCVISNDYYFDVFNNSTFEDVTFKHINLINATFYCTKHIRVIFINTPVCANNFNQANIDVSTSWFYIMVPYKSNIHNVFFETYAVQKCTTYIGNYININIDVLNHIIMINY
jgi:uncharacterized protein YjbI with pentapeptide repeats